VTTLLPSPSSQQNHKREAEVAISLQQSIEEGGGSCRLLFQYKLVVVAFCATSLLRYNEQKRRHCHCHLLSVAKKEKKEGDGSHLLCYATREKKKKATAALLSSPSSLRILA
jgi:hypothetical protein